MNKKIIAVLVAIAATLTYAETVQEPLVETQQSPDKKVVPDNIECHHGSLKKPKCGLGAHQGSVKRATEGAVEAHQGSLKKPKCGLGAHQGSVKQATEGAVEAHQGSLKKPETAIGKDSNADRGGITRSSDAACKGEVNGY